MRFISSLVVLSTIVASLDVFVVATKADRKTVFTDEQTYWNRVLTNQYPAGSTPPPSPRPTTPPPSPTPDLPTEPPTGAPTTPPTPSPPIGPPVLPPTESPVASPTLQPVAPPTGAPVAPPTEAPVAPPTEAPVAPPTEVPPTEAPVEQTAPPAIEPCDVEVQVECTLSTDRSTSCETLEEGVELQCSGCAPVALCFVYTGASCPDPLPPGLSSCEDVGPGPSAEGASIIISDGTNTLANTTISSSAGEVCILNDGAELPSEVRIFVNALGSSLEPSQLSVMDTTCQEGQELQLLSEYGALKLVHYINDCQGDNDCFVNVDYKYTATNTGEVGLTITQFSRTWQDMFRDLLEGVPANELSLETNETYMQTELAVLDCCSGITYTNMVNVSALGDDGSVCDDEDDLILRKAVDTTSPNSASLPPSPTTAPAIITPPTAPSTVTPPTAPSTVTPPTAPSTVTPPTAPSTVTPPTAPSTITPPTAPVTPPTAPSTVAPSTRAPVIVTPPSSILEPSLSPSAELESNFPSLPTDLCFVQVQVDCTPPPQYENCDSIIEFREECLEISYSMGFRYNGGNCDQNFNLQNEQIFRCEDFFGGPPVNEFDESFIVINDIKGLGIVYFSDFVPVGGFVSIAGIGGDILEPNINVTIYDTDAPIPPNIRQTMVIHTSCSQVTFLKDRYGSLELLWFNNTSQGNVTCGVDLLIGFDVQNVAEGFNVVLDALTSITNFPNNEFINMTGQVSGVRLEPGIQAPFSFNVSIDTSIRQRYTAFSTIQGRSPEGFSCRSTDFLNFTAGSLNTAPFFNPTLPPIQSPAQAPIAAPIVAPTLV